MRLPCDTACCRSTTGLFLIKMVQDRRRIGIRPDWDLRPPIERIAHDVGPAVCGFDHTIDIDYTATWRWRWLLVAQGSRIFGMGAVYRGWQADLRDQHGAVGRANRRPGSIARRKAAGALPADDDRAAFRRQRRDIRQRSQGFRTQIRSLHPSPSYDGLVGRRPTSAGPGFDRVTAAPIRSRERSNASTLRIDNRNFTALETMHFMREMMFRQ